MGSCLGHRRILWLPQYDDGNTCVTNMQDYILGVCGWPKLGRGALNRCDARDPGAHVSRSVPVPGVVGTLGCALRTAHRDDPAARRPAQHRLRQAPRRPGQEPPRDPALPQAPHRTRDLPAPHRPARGPQRRRPATTAHPTRTRHRRRSPSPSTPGPHGSQNPKQANATHETSPSATNNTSPISRLDTHRRVNSTGGCDSSAMMAVRRSQHPTGGGTEYGTTPQIRGTRAHRGHGRSGRRRRGDGPALGEAPLDGVSRTRSRQRPRRL